MAAKIQEMRSLVGIFKHLYDGLVIVDIQLKNDNRKKVHFSFDDPRKDADGLNRSFDVQSIFNESFKH